MDAICTNDHIAFFERSISQMDFDSVLGVLDAFDTCTCPDHRLVWQAVVEVRDTTLSVDGDDGNLEPRPKVDQPVRFMADTTIWPMLDLPLDWRYRLSDALEDSKLVQDASCSGEDHQSSAMERNDFAVLFEDDMVDFGELEGMGQGKTDDSSANDNDPEWLL
jgi:hypothetical protein